jgi:hypothetical protein
VTFPALAAVYVGIGDVIQAGAIGAPVTACIRSGGAALSGAPRVEGLTVADLIAPTGAILEDRWEGAMWNPEEDWSGETQAVCEALRPFAAALTRADPMSNEVTCLAEEAIDNLRDFLIQTTWMRATAASAPGMVSVV